MYPIIGLIFLSVTIFSNYFYTRRILRNSEEDLFTQIIISFVLGLSAILCPLYFIGIALGRGFRVTSWIIFLINIIFFIINIAKIIPKFPVYFANLKSYLIKVERSFLNYAFIASIFFIIFKYFFFLSIKGIFDWDAIGLYLPFGRRIFQVDSIPLTGYDYEPIIRPIGISVLYAWMHSVSDSAYDENFRLFPILFVVVTILIIYVLGRDFGSKKIAKVAVIIYILLPIHDAVLFYSSYYPDICYNTLVLCSFFLIYKYMKSEQFIFCFISGISLGLSALLKLQAIYFIPAILFIFISHLEEKRLRLLSTYIISFLFSLFFIYFLWPDPSFFSGLPLTSQILSFSFLFSIITFVAFLMIYRTYNAKIKNIMLLPYVRDIFMFYVVVMAIPSIWFIRNYIYYGSFIWSFQISMKNYSWAITYLTSLENLISVFNINTYLFALVFIPFSVYVLGPWFITILAGIIQIIKRKNTSSLLLIWIMGYLFGYFLFTFYHFEYYYLYVNERDFYPFAPFFSIFAALGINHLTKHYTKNHDEIFLVYLLGSLGFVSLSQSLLIHSYGPTILRNAIDQFAKVFGSSFSILVWQISRKTIFSFIPNIFYFILFLNILIFGIPILWKLIIYLVRRRIKIKLKLGSPVRGWSRRMMPAVLIFSLLVVPYFTMTYEFSGGKIQSFGQNQLKPLWGGLLTEVAPYLENHVEEGDKILMVNNYPLQYYIRRNVSVINLNAPGDLAIFRSITESSNLSMISHSLRDLGIRYFLIQKGTNPLIEKISSESALFSVLRDPKYFCLVKIFNSWDLYEAIEGRNHIVKGWEDDSFVDDWAFLTIEPSKEANYNFTSNGDILTLRVTGNSTVLLEFQGLPNINTTEYQYVACRVKGSPNARWLFGLFPESAKYRWDFPYWWKPSENWEVTVFLISETPLRGVLLDPRACLSLKSIDDNPATLFIDYYMIFKYEPNN